MMRERLRGEEGYKKKLQIIKEAVQEHGAQYDGPVIFVPSAHQLGRMMGRTHGFLYLGPETPWEEKVEAATGLSVIHKGGIVLAQTVEIKQVDIIE